MGILFFFFCCSSSFAMDYHAILDDGRRQANSTADHRPTSSVLHIALSVSFPAQSDTFRVPSRLLLSPSYPTSALSSLCSTLITKLCTPFQYSLPGPMFLSHRPYSSSGMMTVQTFPSSFTGILVAHFVRFRPTRPHSLRHPYF